MRLIAEDGKTNGGDIMKREKLIKMIMAFGIGRKIAAIAAKKALFLYGSYKNAYLQYKAIYAWERGGLSEP